MAVGCTLHRLVAKCVGNTFVSTAVGVWNKEGVYLSNLLHDHLILKLDCKNAEKMLLAVKDLPRAFFFLYILCTVHLYPCLVETSGVQQGDPSTFLSQSTTCALNLNLICTSSTWMVMEPLVDLSMMTTKEGQSINFF